MSLSDLKKWYQKHEKEIVQDYFSYLSFPSISTDPEYKKDVLAAANWVKDYLDQSGFSAELIKTKTYPIVYAEDLSAGKDAPTLLLYGHYDVQPVDPLDEWNSDPFKPVQKGREVYARGALDNKGQSMYTMAALRALKEMHGDLPINIKMIVEGEEETGSYGLEQTLPDIKEKLACDYLLVVDVNIPEDESPAVTLGCRGIYTLSLELQGSNTDLHSGMHGNMAYNPLRALVQLLSKCWDEKGKICIPKFYEDVKELTDEEKKEIDFSFDEKEYQKSYEMGAVWREDGYSLIESNWTRPSFEINGISGGYSGEGFKTVIPAKAIAKVSCRLVPNQDPEKIGESLKAFLQENVPRGMELKIEECGFGSAASGSVDSKVALSARDAYTEVFEKPCAQIFSGGSIPVVSALKLALKSELLLMGVGLAKDNIHAPNESFNLDRFEKGFYVIGRLIETLR